MARPSFSPMISLGNVIQVVLLLLTVAGAWFTLDNRVSNNALSIEKMGGDHQDYSNRIRSIEKEQVRSDERFSSILQSMSRIEKTIDRVAARIDSVGWRQ